ncbi:MAG: hypothetical protein ACK56I_34370, partial [bacterium]
MRDRPRQVVGDHRITCIQAIRLKEMELRLGRVPLQLVDAAERKMGQGGGFPFDQQRLQLMANLLRLLGGKGAPIKG